jgi:hypothetical protein
MAMRVLTVAVAVLALCGAVAARAADREPAAEIQPRVDHHVREATLLVRHFETFVAGQCPHFATVAEWNGYVDREVDRLLLLAAHVEQAWVEAKRTGDDDVRRAAKAPRRRLDEAPQILDKLAVCAQDNGTTFSAGPVYRRIERDLPVRQSEIALPR